MTAARAATDTELELWLAWRREPESGRYNVPLALELTGTVHPGRWSVALRRVAAAHPALRSAFVERDGPLQRITADRVEAPFLVRTEPGGYDRAGALAWAARAALLPLDPGTAPAWRAELRQHADGALLLLTLHHLIADGASVELLAEELCRAYAEADTDEPAAAPEPDHRATESPTAPGAGVGVASPADSPAGLPAGIPVDRPDRPAVDTGGAAESDVDYWAGVLAGAEVLAVPPDAVRGELLGTGRCASVALTADQAAAVRAAATGAHASTAVAALAAWTVVLHWWAGQPEGVLGVPFSGRAGAAGSGAAGSDAVGLHTVMLPVRSRLAAGDTFGTVLDRLRGQWLDSIERSGVDTAALVTGLAAAGTRVPAYRAIFMHLPAASREWQLPGGAARRVEVDLAVPKYEIALAAVETPAGLTLRLDYDGDRYRPDTARALLDQVRDVLVLGAAGPDRPLTRLLDTGGLRRLGTGPAPVGGSWPDPVPRLVEAAAARHPDRVAVRHGDAELTYGELVARARQVAGWLHERGAGPEDVVALLLEPGLDIVVMMLGTALAGAAYLPLDPDYPDQQLTGIVADSAARLAVAAPSQVDRIAGRTAAPVYGSDEVLAAAGYPDADPVPLRPDGLFNVLYTSGSTGRPKGVLLTHLGVSRLLHHPGYLGLAEDDVLPQLSPLNFDGATYEIWGTLAHGGRLVVLDHDLVLGPDELRAELRRHGVTTLLVTTPLLNRLIEDTPDLLQNLRRVSFGGELVSVPHLRRAQRWAPAATLLHGYGPTENSFTSVFTLLPEVPEGARTAPIGRPVPGTEAYVVFDGSTDLTPVGVPGELLLGGVGVARGYLGASRLTAARFRPDPFGGRPGGRLYRTGDRVRWTADGLLEFVGRQDNQVKIRSQRVELGEVQATLTDHEAVEAGFVTTRVNHRGEKEIVGYVVLSAAAGEAGETGETGAAAAVDRIRAYLRARLPGFAVPSHLVPVPELPLTANGKVDRARLPEPAGIDPAGAGSDTAGSGVAAAGAEPIAAPGSGRTRSGVPAVGAVGSSPAGSSTADAAVLAAWQEVLGSTASLPVTANFFDVGGHSLLLARLRDALARRTGARVAVTDLLRYTTIRAQADWLGRRLVPADRVRSGPPAGSTMDTGAVAVIGMAGRFAGSPDLEALWENLVKGRDCLSAATDPAVTPLADGARWISRWGRMPDPHAFDADVFGLSPDDAALLDPQHGVFLECVWAALEDAALRPGEVDGVVSLYAGTNPPLPRPAAAAGSAGSAGSQADALQRAVSRDPAFLATRTAYLLGLCGESVMVDTACSTSLVAVHLACASLRSGSSDYALAGGVSIQDPPGYRYEPGMIYAEDGVCRPFDRRATGTVGGDGAGVVLLRRLADARRDGDPIHAVIRGSAVNNDGRAKAGYTAPGLAGQVAVIRAALDQAGLAGGDVDYVETHGTGTRLGDALEAMALADGLGPHTRPSPVGAVKATLGHCNTAAGIAGLIKTVLALRHGYLPATPNVAEPIPELADGGRLELLAEGRPWSRVDSRPRTAGVSSFGIGGTNAHLLVQEPTEGEAAR